MPTKLSDRETTATKSQPGSYGSFGVGVEDIVFLPLVAIAVIEKVVLRALLTILIDIIDWLFPILLQVMRFPLFTIRILGDGIAALLKGVMRFLPIGNMRRQAWQGSISRNWAWCRQSLSYHAFEESGASPLRGRHGLGFPDLLVVEARAPRCWCSSARRSCFPSISFTIVATRHARAAVRDVVVAAGDVVGRTRRRP